MSEPTENPKPSPINTQFEALKALRDWSSWLVTVGAGVLSIVATALLRNDTKFEGCSPALATFALVCLFSSVICGIRIVGAIPRLIQEKVNTDSGNIYSWENLANVRLRGWAIAQDVLFSLGLIAVSLLAIVRLWFK